MDHKAADISPVIALPDDIIIILDRLNQAGYQGYCVGGCVRDIFLGDNPSDWDIATNATPEQVAAVFVNHSIIPTGLQHGTVTLRLNHQSYEITTYRIDGSYSDSRHPDEVFFTQSIEDDLARRDFTINAMAYHPKEGLIDPFGGRIAIQEKIIACVGNPAHRFIEDPLRILRGFRFACVLGFTIEPKTKQAIKEQINHLGKIAVERIQAELNKAIAGDYVAKTFFEYSFILLAILPELRPILDLPQNNPHHIDSVWEHTIHSIATAESFIPRLTMLFHDSGKALTHSVDERGIAHFYRHAKYSEEIAKRTLQRLRYPNETIAQVCLLVRYHDATLVNRKNVIKRWMNRMGQEAFVQLLEVKRADALAQSPDYLEESLQHLAQIHWTVGEILKSEECFSLSQLAINGSDLINFGIPKGKQIGVMLQKLLNLVVEDTVPNDKSSLLQYLEENHTANDCE